MSTTLSSSPPTVPPRIDANCPEQGTVRVAVTGEIDLSTADLLRAALLGVLVAQRPRRIEVDLAEVTFLDCGGVAVLVVVGNAAARTGCQLRITNPRPIVRRVLDLTGLLDILTARFARIPLVPTGCAPGSPTDPAPDGMTPQTRLLVAA